MSIRTSGTPSGSFNDVLTKITPLLPKEFKRGDIYYIDRAGGQSVGNEQTAGRPAIIVSNDAGNKHSDNITVVYLTTQPKSELPTHIFINSSQKVSIALCETVTTVSKQRAGDYYGAATPQEMQQIDKALAVALGLEPETAVTTSEPQADISQLSQQIAAAKREVNFYKALYEETLEKCRILAVEEAGE